MPAPRFGVASGGGERKGEGQPGEEVEAAPSNCGSELSMIDEGGEECEETEACPPSEEHGRALSLEEELNEGQPCCTHGGPTLCAAACTPPPPPPRAGRCPLLTSPEARLTTPSHSNPILTCS